MIGRYINLGRLTHNNRYVFSFFSKPGAPSEKFKVPLFKNQPKEKEVFTTNENSSSAKKTLEDIVSKINEANKYFLGVKLNTNYLKINKTVKYVEISQQKLPSATSNDFPLDFSKDSKKLDSFKSFNDSSILQKKSAQIAFSHCSKERAIEGMQELIKNFIVNLAENKRLKNLEPNYELHTIKAMNSLRDSLKLTLKNSDQLPEIKIKDITLLRGLGVYRNNNYSSDSYGKDQSEASNGIIIYNLFRQKKEDYPEIEWFSTKKINVRFELLVQGGPVIEVKENGTFLGSTENVVHNVVIESSLVVPPIMAEHQLTPEEFLKSYRLRVSNLILTNFDRKNAYYPLTFTETEKKDLLINKIQ